MDKERKIIDSIKSGESNRALNYLYEQPLRKVRTYILRNSGTIEDANDIFQDSVVIFFNSVRENKFKEEYSIEGYIYTIAKNLWISKIRKENKFGNDLNVYEMEISNGIKNQLEQIMDKEKSSAMSKLFDQLDEKCKKILAYVIYHKMSMTEIKDKMGYASEDVAKSNHYRCKQYLSKIAKNNTEIYNTLKN